MAGQRDSVSSWIGWILTAESNLRDEVSNSTYMPIRALVNDVEVTLPVSEQDWGIVRRAARIVLSCCNCTGYARRSKLGLQHFVHSKPNPKCAWKAESLQHILCKQEIVLGCRDAGYEAQSEFAGDGWRADVLAWKNSVRVAFEVQLSKQGLDETLARQARYRANNVRCCWLFSQPPEKITQPEIEYDDDPFGSYHPTPCHNVPIFKLAIRRLVPRVNINDREIELRHFIKLLLSRHVQFRAQISFTSRRIVFDIKEAMCVSCSSLYRFLAFRDNVYASRCGVVCKDQGYEPSGRLEQCVLDAVLAYADSAQFRDLNLNVKKAFHANGCNDLAFYCRCGQRVFPNWKSRGKRCKSPRHFVIPAPLSMPVSHQVRH